MNPLEVLKAHYVGKAIRAGSDVRPEHIGKTILDVQVDSYEPMLEFVVRGKDKTEIITVLFDWKIVV